MRRHSLYAPLTLAAIYVAWAVACSPNAEIARRSPASSGGSGSGLGGNISVDPDGGFVIVGSTGGGVNGDPNAVRLVVYADTLELEVSGSPVETNFRAEYEDGTIPNEVVWTVDDTRIGSIGQDGKFTANGTVGGEVLITAQAGSQSVSLTLVVRFKFISNPGVSSTDEAALLAGGSSDATFRWLYPYDKTVFPRGLKPPLLQLSGTAADWVYLKLSSGFYSYEAYSGPTNPISISIPEDVWKGIALSVGPSDWIDVSVTKLSGTEVTGPVTESWVIAQGALKGTVYYNSYASSLHNWDGGAILKVPLGGEASLVSNPGECVVCHSVSANGNVIAGVKDWQGGPRTAISFNADAQGTISERFRSTDTRSGWKFTFPALTPDGSKGLTNASVEGNLRSDYGGAAAASQLVDTATGEILPSEGLNGLQALTPIFSPDGTLIAFNDDTADATGHILSVMDFDGDHTFSDLRQAVQSAAKIAAWPTFTADNGALVYQEGASWGTENNLAELRLVDLGNGEVSALQALNGWNADASLYLPWGAAEDANVDYEPTLLPRPIGGYYWVMFTSRRAYGNSVAPGAPGTLGAARFAKESPRKKIWVAAIDLDYMGKVDPSHPAFYLDGQELLAGNLRPFAALEPCREQGASCESGADCCERFCREVDRDAQGTPILQCVPPPESGCSNLDEACGGAADCCNSAHLCIGGRCTLPAPEPPPPR